MPKITIKLDIQKDAWNWWHACNHVSYSVDWKQRIDQSIWENIHGKSQEQAFKFLLPYLKNNYIKQHNQLELYQKQASLIIKQNANRACRWLEKITEQPLACQDITLYLTTFPRCPYNYEKGYIWTCAIWPAKQVMDTLLHELLHFQFYAYFKNRESVKKLSAAQAEDLKEALTVILNYEFREYLAQSDKGYSVHQKLRQKLASFWQKNKDFGKLVDYGAEQIVKNRVLKMINFW